MPSRARVSSPFTRLALAAAVLAGSAGGAAAQTSLRFTNYGPPQDTSPSLGASTGDLGVGSTAGEPSIGVNHATGAMMYIASLETLRLERQQCPAATIEASPPTIVWLNKSFTTTSIRTLDPILFTDHTTERTFSSQLAGKCSAMAYSDDDGENWTPSQGCGMNAGADHQTVGGGPFPASDPIKGTGPYQHAVYYCSQDVGLAQCALSRDGGATFGAAVPIYTQADCDELGGKLHGHVKVAPDGTAYVPNSTCSGHQIVSVSENSGTTWTVREIPQSSNGQGLDPAVYADAANRIYFGYVDGDGKVKVTTSNDRGLTWTPSVDVGAAVGVVAGAFPQVVAGDAGRAAIAFLGSDNPDLTGAYGTDVTAPHTWYLYVAMTYDAGASWQTINVTPDDPVQRGTVCMQGTLCAAGRNLLDFNEIDVTEDGRAVVAYADGCVGACIPGPPNSGTDVARIALQTGGKRLYAAFDAQATDPPAAPAVEAIWSPPYVTLTWSEPESATAIVNYRIDRQRTGEPGFTTLATVDAATFSYLDIPGGSNPDQTLYRVVAINGAGAGTHCGEPDLLPSLGSTVSCTPPGVRVAVDSFDALPVANSNYDAQSVSISEPFLGAGVDRLRFTVELADLTSPLPAGSWVVLWNRPTPDGAADRNYIAMKSTGATVSFEHGTVSPPNANVATPTGVLTGSVDFAADTFTVDADPALFDGIGAGSDMPGVELRVFAVTNPAAVTQSAATDFTGAGSYTLVGNAACAPNGLPIAQDDAAFTDPGEAKVIDVLANDTDPNNDPLHVAVVFQPPHGTTAKTPEGEVLYTPDNGFSGVDTFQYKVADGRGGDAIGDVTVTVQNLPNFAPHAVDDEATVPAGHSVAIDVVANDTDLDGDELTIASVTLPAACGTPLLDAGANRINFFADSDFLGGCCFNYVVQDGNGGADTGEVCVSVTCAPVATGNLSYDFEADAQGFTTEHVEPGPAGSLDWARTNGPPGATNVDPLNIAWYTNDPAITDLTSKDDRLISPLVDVSALSHLEFRHRFSTEDTFDGGILQVSLDGGGSWQTVPGTAFLTGGYNSTATGLPEAWAGDSPDLPDVNDVEVDLSAYAGFGRRFRWRFLADTNVGTEGWWVDDVHFTNTFVPGTCDPIAPCQPGGSLCYHTAIPCRLYDSRQDTTNGALDSGVERAIPAAGAAVCTIPATARALAVNLTVVSPSAGGHVTVYPEPGNTPATSTLNFSAAQTRSNNAVVDLNDLGALIARPFLSDGGTVELVVDVYGWFE